jgi:hypothetical protein
MQAAPALQEYLTKIKHIHDKYLHDISLSTNTNQDIANSIREYISKFNSNISDKSEIFERNKEIMLTKYYEETKSGPRGSQSPQSKFEEELMTVAALILTCYSLNMFNEFVVLEKVGNDQSDSKDVEDIDNQVSDFITFYLYIYTTIEKLRQAGFDENKTCLELQEKYETIRCKSSLTTFFEKIKNLISSRFTQAGGKKDSLSWKYKYLKYKKKYLNIKNKKK